MKIFRAMTIPKCLRKADSYDDKRAENEFDIELIMDMRAQRLGYRNPKGSYVKMDELVTMLRAKSWRMRNNIENLIWN